MKIKCEREDLYRILMAAQSITSTVKSTYIAASNIMIETVDGGAIVSSSNGELNLGAFIPADIEEEGKVSIVHQKLFDFVKQLPAEKILIEKVEDKKTAIRTTGKSRNVSANIVGVDVEEMSNLQSYDSSLNSIVIDKLYFKKIIKKTRFCVSMDDVKYTLNGIYIECNKDTIKAVAIDGRRLAIIENKYPKNEHVPFSVILPQPLLNILEKTIQTEGPLNFYFKDGMVFFKFDGMEISSKILGGKFPDYDVFLFKKNPIKLTCDTKKFLAAINAVSVLTDQESKKLYCHVLEGKLKMSSNSSDYGNTEEIIDVEYSDEEKYFALNYSLLSEIINEIETEKVVISFDEVLAPFNIREKDRDEYYYIIMPMKVESS